MLYAMFDGSDRLDRRMMHRQTRLMHQLGCAGVTVLGLATEVNKLTDSERRTLVDWLAEDLQAGGGGLPMGVTIAGDSVAEQLALARHAQAQGADWLILQPPAVKLANSTELIRFFGAVADAVDLPIAIQNAPDFLGQSLSADEIVALVRQHANINHLKGEDSAVGIARIVDALGRELTVLNGRAGLELTDNLRAGCAGFILAADTVDIGLRVYAAWQQGDTEQAEQHYQQGLPAIVFVMQSLEQLVTYGKRLYAARTGEVVHDRLPALPVTAFGERCVQHWASHLGPHDMSGL
jgi:4-hydroxy-tetrahydrodipicolinate synthase